MRYFYIYAGGIITYAHQGTDFNRACFSNMCTVGPFWSFEEAEHVRNLWIPRTIR